MTERPYHPSHDMVMDEYGVDIWRVEQGFHNGPECRNCGSWCRHCDPDRARKPCANDREVTP